MGEGFDIHILWYSVTTIMMGKPGDKLVTKVITVFANI
jgi:hypothetical protein